MCTLKVYNKAETEMLQVRIYIKQWFARKIGTPRELQVTIKHETEKAYLIKGHALATPTSTCRHCGRRLTHPVSVLYGIGPECGKHYHIPQHPEDVEAIRKMIEQIEYEGWIPKSAMEVFEEVGI
jgi:hypothetical protein